MSGIEAIRFQQNDVVFSSGNAMSVVYFYYHPGNQGFAVRLADQLELNGFSVSGLHGPNAAAIRFPLSAATLGDADCIAILCSVEAADDPAFIDPSVLEQLRDRLIFVSVDGSRPSDGTSWAKGCSVADLSDWDGLGDHPVFERLLDMLKGSLINSAVKAVAAASNSSVQDRRVDTESLESLEENARRHLDDILVAGAGGDAPATLNPELGPDGLAALLASHHLAENPELSEPAAQPTETQGSSLSKSMREAMREAESSQISDTLDLPQPTLSPPDIGSASGGAGATSRLGPPAPTEPLNAADSPRSSIPQPAEDAPLASGSAVREPAAMRSRSSSSAALKLAIVAAGLGAIGWFFGKQILEILSNALAALLAVKGTMPPGPAAAETAMEAPGDDVDCTVFAPPSAPPGGTILVQVFLHLPDQSERAEELATTFDDTAKARMFKSLDVHIPRGAKVQIFFDCQDLAVESPTQEIIWRGRPEPCNFLVTLPETEMARDYYPVIQVSIDETPAGRIQFKLTADATVTSATLAAEPQGETSRYYRYAFLSYASKDRAEVLKRAQSLRATNIDFFQDILSLDPGERWESALYSHIDNCDLFLLFWSKAAAESEWVLKEIEYALARRRDSGESVPDIKPIILESPPPLPPAHLEGGLGGQHLDDYLSYLIAAFAEERASLRD